MAGNADRSPTSDDAPAAAVVAPMDHAMTPQTRASSANPIARPNVWPWMVMRGSMSHGYTRSAISDPTLEIANRRYGCDGRSAAPAGGALVARAYHAWRSGLVADSVTNGMPIRIVSRMRTLAIGCVGSACERASI